MSKGHRGANPCPRSYVGRQGYGRLYIGILYLGYRVLCHLVQYACPIVLQLISDL